MGRPLRAIEEDIEEDFEEDFDEDFDVPRDVPRWHLPRSGPHLELLEAVAAIDVPFVRRKIAGRPVVFVNEPELIAQVLVSRAASFEKSQLQRWVMGAAECSETVFSPAATRRHVRELAVLAREERDRWQDGATIELGAAFMRLSATIEASTLFSWELAPGDQAIGDDLVLIGNALTWTLYLLSRHPEAALRIRDEIAAAGATGGEITPEVLQRLPFTLQVFKEALRLYPPGYAFGRRAIEDLHLGPLRIEKDSEVVVSPYALHRRPTLFERPGQFDPARFEEGRESERHPCAYLPFGAGPGGCIGGGLALLQGQVVLAVLLGEWQVTPASHDPVLPEPRMTLRPASPVRVIVHKHAERG